jgi:hypothetical protein
MTKVFEELIYGWFFWSLLYGPPQTVPMTILKTSTSFLL